tara:strand:- start:467 stop:943 length:477 start_codon:yes stop_codon:yes gene_type:complete
MNDKKSRYILHWIDQLSKIRPELGNFAICPYASKANFSILDSKLSQIVPKPDFDVVIYVVEDNISAQFLYDAVDDYNRNYPEYKFIPDHGKTKTYIQGMQTSNGLYNLVLCQPRKELTEARKKLARTDYYNYWDESYLKEVLEEDYPVVNIHIEPELG